MLIEPSRLWSGRAGPGLPARRADDAEQSLDRSVFAVAAAEAGGQDDVARCSVSRAATWSEACSGSQCEAPSSSARR